MSGSGWIAKILGIFSGIFFLSLAVPVCGDGLALATALFEEGDWAGGRREAARFLVAHPGDEQATLIYATASLREAFHAGDAASLLTGLVARAEGEIRAIAAYEAARYFWGEGDLTTAWPLMRMAFETTYSPWLYLRSGLGLDMLRRQDRSLIQDAPELALQLETTRRVWNRFMRDEVRPDRKDRRASYSPGALAVAFYRSQVGPAIGHRCELHPSCSEYYLQANHHHGWMGIPMIADRLVREPGVVSRAEYPVVIKGRTLLADPLADHDYWFRSKKDKP